jgi:hypothetical protein|eukprot:COSAG01_NODE_2189_length_8193_cov_47.570917_4_plen_36_part_00
MAGQIVAAERAREKLEVSDMIGRHRQQAHAAEHGL